MLRPKGKKMANATVQGIVNRLNKAGIEAWKTSDQYAVFEQGIIGIPPGGKLPVIFFDFRADPADKEQLLAALHGVGSWALSKSCIYLKRTAAGIKVLTMEQAMEEIGCDFIFGQSDRLFQRAN